MAAVEVWDPRAVAYQRTLLASLRSHVLDPASLSSPSSPLRDQVVAAFHLHGPAGAQSVDLFESAALCALEDADLILFEAFLWNSVKRPYRTFPSLNPPSTPGRILTYKPRLGVPLLQLVAGFCRLDVICEWRSKGLLSEAVLRSLRFYFERPRFPTLSSALPSSIPTPLERLCLKAVGGIEREAGAGEWESLEVVRETSRADRLAHLMSNSPLGLLWAETLARSP